MNFLATRTAGLRMLTTVPDLTVESLLGLAVNEPTEHVLVSQRGEGDTGKAGIKKSVHFIANLSGRGN